MPKKNKIVYKYEGGARQRASGTISDTMSDIMTNDIMTKYKTLKRCRLPDLDLTVPVSTEVTWGRPLTQEEIDHLRALDSARIISGSSRTGWRLGSGTGLLPS